MASTTQDLKIEHIVKEFKELCNKHSRITENIRTYCGHWGSGVASVPEEIRSNIGCIISLLQDKVNSDLFCTKDQCLIIYNFQISAHESPFYVLEMLIKPKLKDELTEIYSLTGGEGIQLVVDEEGNIINNNHFLELMELLDEDQALQDPQHAMVTTMTTLLLYFLN